MMMRLTMEMMMKMTMLMMILMRMNLVVLGFAADRVVVVLPKLEVKMLII